METQQLEGNIKDREEASENISDILARIKQRERESPIIF